MIIQTLEQKSAQELVGLQIDQLSELRNGNITFEQMKWFNNLTFEQREALMGKQPDFEFTVQVDRSIKPVYPDWMKEVKHPELECSGPATYDLQSLELWLHDKQKNSNLEGNAIYKEMEKNLESCLNLQDILAIQVKGI